MLMSLGALSTVARVDPPNLVVVMDNAAYETTGGQETLSTEVDFVGVARECGLPAWPIDSNGAFREAYADAVGADGAAVVCEVEPRRPEAYPPLDYGHATSNTGSGGSSSGACRLLRRAEAVRSTRTRLGRRLSAESLSTPSARKLQ